jgi:hypothetical protein
MSVSGRLELLRRCYPLPTMRPGQVGGHEVVPEDRGRRAAGPHRKRAIRTLQARGSSIRAIAGELKVSTTEVQRAVAAARWRYVVVA